MDASVYMDHLLDLLFNSSKKLGGEPEGQLCNRNLPASFFTEPNLDPCPSIEHPNQSRDNLDDSRIIQAVPRVVDQQHQMQSSHCRSKSSPLVHNYQHQVHSSLNVPAVNHGRVASVHHLNTTSPSSFQDRASPLSPEEVSYVQSLKKDKHFLAAVHHLAEQLDLPEGWEVQFTPAKESYFIDHVNKSTTWTDPRVEVAERQLLGAELRQLEIRREISQIVRRKQQLQSQYVSLDKQELALRRSLEEDMTSLSLNNSHSRSSSSLAELQHNSSPLSHEYLPVLGGAGGVVRGSGGGVSQSHKVLHARQSSADSGIWTGPVCGSGGLSQMQRTLSNNSCVPSPENNPAHGGTHPPHLQHLTSSPPEANNNNPICAQFTSYKAAPFNGPKTATNYGFMMQQSGMSNSSTNSGVVSSSPVLDTPDQQLQQQPQQQYHRQQPQLIHNSSSSSHHAPALVSVRQQATAPPPLSSEVRGHQRSNSHLSNNPSRGGYNSGAGGSFGNQSSVIVSMHYVNQQQQQAGLAADLHASGPNFQISHAKSFSHGANASASGSAGEMVGAPVGGCLIESLVVSGSANMHPESSSHCTTANVDPGGAHSTQDVISTMETDEDEMLHKLLEDCMFNNSVSNNHHGSTSAMSAAAVVNLHASADPAVRSTGVLGSTCSRSADSLNVNSSSCGNVSSEGMDASTSFPSNIHPGGLPVFH